MSLSSRWGRGPSSFLPNSSTPKTPFIEPEFHHAARYLDQLDPTGPNPYDPSKFANTARLETTTTTTTTAVTTPSYHYPRAIKPIVEIPTSYQPTIWTPIKKLFGWKPPVNPYIPAPFTVVSNPYRARKAWPPDFRDLHPKKEFHFEKTYRRRAKLAYTKPAWNRKIKLIQHTLVVSTTIYFVLIHEPGDMGTPFDGLRVWFFSKLKNFAPIPESTRAAIEEAELESRLIKDRRARQPWSFEPGAKKEDEPVLE